MRKLTFLVLCCLFLISCEKEPDTMTLIMNPSGTVSLKVIDNNQNGFQGAKVSIFSSIPEGERIAFDSTDASGICNIGKVLQGQYSYYVSALKDKKSYSINGYFQVIGGDDKVVEANPFSNVGNARVKIVNLNSQPIANVKVALIPHPNYSEEFYTFQGLIDESYAIQTTDAEGWVEFKDMPAEASYSRIYSVLIYTDSNNYSYSWSNNQVAITHGYDRNYTIQVNL